MCLSVLTKVSIGIGGLPQAFIIDLINIQSSKSPKQTHNA